MPVSFRLLRQVILFLPAAIHVNAMGTFHVLEAARLFEVPQVLFSSSISTYGLDFEGRVIDDTTHTYQAKREQEETAGAMIE